MSRTKYIKSTILQIKLGSEVNVGFSLSLMPSRIYSTDSQQLAKSCKSINNIIMWGWIKFH